MYLPSLESNQERWNRLLLKSYWIIFMLSILLEFLFLQVTILTSGEFLQLYIIRPTVILGLIVLPAEIGVRYLPKHHEYVLISTAILIAFSLTAVHSAEEYLLSLLLFPILISIFYFQYKKLLFSIGSTLSGLYLLYFFDPDIRNGIAFEGLILMTCIILVFGIVACGVLARGREVLIHLRTSYESNQELLVRTILMDKLAKTDALTDTYNHMAYHEYKDHLVEQADKGKLTLHLAILDIDNFKKVNDTYGHKAGDEVLREVASIARSKTGSNDFIARYGGEEFVILFTEKNFQEVYTLVEDIRTSIASTSHAALQGLNVTVSIGLNPYSPGMGKEQLFLAADTALYQAKHSGKNRTVTASSQ